MVPTVGGAAVPLFERFFLGGPYSVRGFKSRSISPTDPNTGDAIGGNKELVANLEYLFPLVSEISFKGVLFFDAGNAWAQSSWPVKDQGCGRPTEWAYAGTPRWGRCASSGDGISTARRGSRSV